MINLPAKQNPSLDLVRVRVGLQQVPEALGLPSEHVRWTKLFEWPVFVSTLLSYAIWGTWRVIDGRGAVGMFWPILSTTVFGALGLAVYRDWALSRKLGLSDSIITYAISSGDWLEAGRAQLDAEANCLLPHGAAASLLEEFVDQHFGEVRAVELGLLILARRFADLDEDPSHGLGTLMASAQRVATPRALFLPASCIVRTGWAVFDRRLLKPVWK